MLLLMQHGLQCGGPWRNVRCVCCTAHAALCSPNFVYPVRRGEGKYFTLFAQWQVSCIMSAVPLCAAWR